MNRIINTAMTDQLDLHINGVKRDVDFETDWIAQKSRYEKYKCIQDRHFTKGLMDGCTPEHGNSRYTTPTLRSSRCPGFKIIFVISSLSSLVP
jgi:hypothetical protein